MINLLTLIGIVTVTWSLTKLIHWILLYLDKRAGKLPQDWKFDKGDRG